MIPTHCFTAMPQPNGLAVRRILAPLWLLMACSATLATDPPTPTPLRTHFADLATELPQSEPGVAEVGPELRALMSFGYSDQVGGWLLPIPQRLNIEFRRHRPTGSNRLFVDMGYGTAEAGVQYRFQQLESAAGGDPQLLAAVTASRKLVVERLKIARFNQNWGNTPDSSVWAGLSFMNSLRGKLAALGRAIDADTAAERLVSPETWRRLQDMQGSVGNGALERFISGQSQLGGLLPPQSELQAMLMGVEAVACDSAAEIWRTRLLPAAIAAAGPRIAAPVVETSVVFGRDPMVVENESLLRAVALVNRSGRTLTNVTVELQAQNSFDDRRPQYYAFREWPDGAVRYLTPHHWLAMQTYTSSLQVAGRLWSDQLSADIAPVKQANPKPVLTALFRYKFFTHYQEKQARQAMQWATAVQIYQDLPAPKAP